MHILIAADGSAYTEKATEFVASHLDWFAGNPQLHLFHVEVPIASKRAWAALDSDAVDNLNPLLDTDAQGRRSA